MRILLSSFIPESGTDLQLALHYLKAYLLKEQGNAARNLCVDIRVFNQRQRLDSAAKMIREFNPRLTGFSCYLWNIEKTLKLCRILKESKKRIMIVLGGPEVSARAGEILGRHNYIDAVVRGEGEETFSELARFAIKNKNDISAVRGVSFLRRGEIIHNPDRPSLQDINRIPSPYLNRQIDLEDRDIVDVPLETSRGCVFRCAYCYYHKNSPRVRYFPFSRIEAELRLILSAKPREVYLMDATFNADPERAKKILRIFIKHNRGSYLHVELRAETLDDESARLLREANAADIEIGIQSTSARALKAVNRGLDKGKFARGIRLLNKYGLSHEVQLIDGLPFHNYQRLKSSVDWLCFRGVNKLTIFRLSLLPGTLLRQRAAEYGITYQGRAPYQTSRTLFMPKEDFIKTERLRFAIERLYNNQVMRPALLRMSSLSGLGITGVMEEWLQWENGIKKRGYAYPDLLNRRFTGFLDYFCDKNNKHGLKDRILACLPRLPADQGYKNRRQ